MDVRRWELNPDAPRSGWRYWLEVALVISDLLWLPLLLVVGVVLLVRELL